MNKIILIFIAIFVIFGGIYIYTLPPKSPLPNINYIGMSRSAVIDTLVNKPVLDRKTNKNLGTDLDKTGRNGNLSSMIWYKDSF